MTKLEQAVKDIHITDHAGVNAEKSGIHSLAYLLVTLLYIFAVLSFGRYDVSGLGAMALYILVQCIWYEVSVREMLKHIWPVFILTGMIGIANPFLDRNVYVSYEFFSMGSLTITYGMISMITLMLKGMFCVMASYLLINRIGIRQICYALHLLHLPEEIVTVLMLMHRYLIVLLKELGRMQQAYKLRAPGQRGLHIRAWGSFAGLLLLRSIDRAGEVYESMQLRGFHGKMKYPPAESNKGLSILFVLIWGFVFVLLRIFPVFRMVGSFL